MKPISFFCSSIFFFCISLFSLSSISAQTMVDEGTYDLQFEEFVEGCGSGGNDNYCVRLQIKSASDAESFAIGSHTFYFTFNNNSISNPSYIDINFGDNGTCAEGSAAYMKPAFFADVFTGEANVTTIMELPNQGCPIVDGEWRSIGLVCFEVIDDAETTQLAFGVEFTEVNKNDDTPRHNQGTFSDLDELPIVVNSPANVDLAVNAPTEASICSDENFALLAELSTLNFGPQVGTNPVVGWAISTTDPGEDSPLLAEGYTEIILPGDALTTLSSVSGTNDGLDPYGLNVSTLWFSPMTFINFDEESGMLELDFGCFDWGTAVEINFLADNTGDCPTTCTANVDLSDQIGQEIGICSDESVELLADLNTLDFGENVGENPVVAWAIFTEMPQEGVVPFDDPNYTGGLIAGNAETTSVTINGTNDGMDPFGFNASVLHFVPITFINYDPDADPALVYDFNCFDWGESIAVSFYADGFLDCPLPCDANVEVAEGVDLEVSLCAEESHTVSVNTATLDFGVNEGDNPLVGWVISTADPGEMSPFGQEGFTGFAFPGNDADQNVTITGTADGLDPYELGLSTLWLTPVTYINYDEEANAFDLDDNCFDWGESVQINFVADGMGDCNPACPSTTGNFSRIENLCDGDTATVPDDETILNNLDFPDNAIINWSMDPTQPLVYEGDGCEVQNIVINLTITCSEDETISLDAGTFNLTLYPVPQAPTVVFNNASTCSYTVVPNCPNDAVLPAEVSDQAPGTSGITQTFTVSNDGCTELTFEDIPVPDCEEIPPQCPTSVGDFSGSENICDMGLVSVPTNEAILASLDDATNALIEWSLDPSSPVVYEGDGCTPQQIDYVLTIRCSDDENVVLNGGTHTVFVYPNPQAPTVNLISATEICQYELIPHCETDVLDPAEIEDQVAGSGELVQIVKVTNEACSGLNFFDVTIPACPGICPTSAGDFSANEDLCEGDLPNVASDEEILASIDLADRATINWTPDPSQPLVYEGDGCNPEVVIFNLSIGCQADGSVAIAGGTHIVNLYPSPQAPTVELIENVDGFCSYNVVPACENDVVSPSSIEDLAGGSLGVTLPFNVSNGGCNEALFEAVEVPDCLFDDIDPIQYPNQLQMEVSPNFLPIGSLSHIEVYLPKSGHTVLEVLDISGRRVVSLYQGSLPSDVHDFEWNVENLSSGLYFVHLQTEYGHEVRKVIVGN